MDINEQNKIMSQNRNNREVHAKLDQITLMLEILAKEVAELKTAKRTRVKKEEA